MIMYVVLFHKSTYNCICKSKTHTVEVACHQMPLLDHVLILVFEIDYPVRDRPEMQ
jgi:hypothetical protein